MNGGIYWRTLILGGLIAILLNAQLLHFDEEFFIGIFSCIFFFTLYRLIRGSLSGMFFQHCDLVYVTLAFLMHTILVSLQVCKQLLNWTLLKLHANELWTLLSYTRLLSVSSLGSGNMRGIIGSILLAPVISSSKNKTQ